jgi:WD40 repeat protein
LLTKFNVYCYTAAEMKTNSKLSSLVWNPYIKHRIASADYEGAIHMWDVNRGEMIDQLSEHKKRVWWGGCTSQIQFIPIARKRLVSDP